MTVTSLTQYRAARLKAELEPLLERIRALNLPPVPPRTPEQQEQFRERLRWHTGDDEPTGCADVWDIATGCLAMPSGSRPLPAGEGP